MRTCLPCGTKAENFGLAYDVLGPAPRQRGRGKPPEVDPGERQSWLEGCAGIATPSDYGIHYERWQNSFGSSTQLCVVKTASRLLIGHGNASASDVGLTVHRTWGTPVIPGTALKGLLAGYIDVVYGPDVSCSDPARVDWIAPTWSGFNVEKAPGEWHALIFGSPAVPSDDRYRHGLRGSITFHDALYIPSGHRPYEPDVLTVHQKPYYDGHGSEWPNDWNAPVPVPFLTVKPGVRFLLVLEGPPRATKVAMEMLVKALRDWGIGAKTAAGYGAMTRDCDKEKQVRSEIEKHERKEREAKERAEWIAALSPIEQEIERIFEGRKDRGMSKIVTIFQAVEAGTWREGAKIAVAKIDLAKWLHRKMEDDGRWKEKSNARNPAKDADHRRTLLVMDWLRNT